MNSLQKNISVKQDGAALLVSMVLIFMLTILGLSAMRDSTMETRLVANAVHKEVSFQSAESATDVVLAIDDPSAANAIEAVICKPDLELTLDELSRPNVQTTKVTIEYAGQSILPGMSVGGPFGGRRFVITGESTLLDAATSTKISQGVVAIGATQQGVDC